MYFKYCYINVRTCVPQKVTEFTQDAISLAAGEELKCGDRLNVFSILRREFGRWIAHLDRSGANCECTPIILQSPTVQQQDSEVYTVFVCVLQLTRRLRGRWRNMKRSTVEENCRASSTTRPLSLWSRSRSDSWKNQLLRDSKT